MVQSRSIFVARAETRLDRLETLGGWSSLKLTWIAALNQRSR